MGMPGMTELLIILAIVLVLFGSRKIPELMKGMGSGIRNFKSELNKDDEDEKSEEEKEKLEKTAESDKPDGDKRDANKPDAEKKADTSSHSTQQA